MKTGKKFAILLLLTMAIVIAFGVVIWWRRNDVKEQPLSFDKIGQYFVDSSGKKHEFIPPGVLKITDSHGGVRYVESHREEALAELEKERKEMREKEEALGFRPAPRESAPEAPGEKK